MVGYKSTKKKTPQCNKQEQSSLFAGSVSEMNGGPWGSVTNWKHEELGLCGDLVHLRPN